MEILRYAAFSGDPAGGNPAGIVLDAADLDDASMQRIAADIGFSETAFLVPTGPTTARVRYFAPIAEVPFCGHATIASAVARAERVGVGALTLDSPVGPIQVTTADGPDGIVATLVSVPPVVTDLPNSTTAALLAALRLAEGDLDPRLPIRVSFSGNHHPIVGVPLAVLDRLDYDQPALTSLMARKWLGCNGCRRREDCRCGVRGAEPVPAGRGAGGPGNRVRGGGAGRLPPGARPGRAARSDHRQAGPARRSSRPADRGYSRGRRRDRGVRAGSADGVEPPDRSVTGRDGPAGVAQTDALISTGA